MKNTYYTHILPDPALPLYFLPAKSAKSKIYDHTNWHENVEFLFFTKGEGKVFIDGKRFDVREGDLVTINANALHAIVNEFELTYHCLIVDRSFCLNNHFDTNLIRFDPLVRDDLAFQYIKTIVEEYDSDPATPYRVQAIRATLLLLLSHMCRQHSQRLEHEPRDRHTISCIKQAISYIRANCQNDLFLEDLASLVGLSKYYFARYFHRVTGYTFVSYVNLTRCEKAKGLLIENQLSLKEIATKCGFSNQSYFTKTFLIYTGRLPSEYREEKLRKQSNTPKP